MEQKGLSQILYLIIAASVLMMIAMVVTFTATDTIGGLGGQAEQGACTDALTAQCAATDASWIEVPPTCVTEGQYVGGLSSSLVYDTRGTSGNNVNAPNLATTPSYIQCGTF